MYEGVIYIAGAIESLGADAVEAPMTDDDVLALGAALAGVGSDLAAGGFRKVESGRALWNFSAKDSERWRSQQ
jgi:hypothetical protein